MSRVVVVETLRRHFTNLAYVAALAGVVLVEAFMGLQDAPPVMTRQLIMLFTFIAGCQLIGPELSSGTLQLIISKPIPRARYLISRVTGVVLALWVVVIAMFIADVIGRAGGGHAIAWLDGGSRAAGSAARIALNCSLLALFGSMARSYVNVAILAGGDLASQLIENALRSFEEDGATGVLEPAGRFLRMHPSIREGFHIVHENIFPNLPATAWDGEWFLMVACSAAVALFLACLVFRTKEVPYGAD